MINGQIIQITFFSPILPHFPPRKPWCDEQPLFNHHKFYFASGREEKLEFRLTAKSFSAIRFFPLQFPHRGENLPR